MRNVLSILIPTIPSRADVFARLSTEVMEQIFNLRMNHPTLGTVELLSDAKPAYLDGGPSIGKKRQSLLERANAKYLCFLDDDEVISPVYVETLVRLCLHERDLVTFRAFVKTDYYWTLCNMSLENEENEEINPLKVIQRTPWHTCPVRSRLAKKFDFPDTNDGEDFAWMRQVLRVCNNEIHTDQILLQYNSSAKNSESSKIIRAGYV